MLLFAANDPGSQNHIKPIYLRAVADGVEAEIIDLMSAPEFAVDARAIELIEQRRPSLLVSGSSSNQEEKALVQACKAKGNATLSVVDFAVGRKLKGREPDNLSDRFLVTNQFAANELLDLGVDSERVILAGSTHLEQVFLAGFDQPAESIISHYGIEPGKAVVSFFCAANQANSVRAVASLADNLAGMPIESAQVIIKPHPRMLDKQKLKEICERVDQFIYDSEGTTSTASILAASNLSLSIASTVSLESIILGVPSAFFLIGLDDGTYEDPIPHITSVPRIRDSATFGRFLHEALDRQSNLGNLDVENFSGSLDRSWAVIQSMLASA